MAILPFRRLYDPFSDVLEALLSGGKKSPRKQTCTACGETDYPRADYPAHALYCRHCDGEIRWWIRG